MQASAIIAAAFSLSQPAWLVALLLLAGPLLLAVRSRRQGRPVSLRTVGLQSLAVSAATVALADPAVRLRTHADRPFLFFRDVSASTRGQHEDVFPWPDDLAREVILFAEGLGSHQDPPGQDQTRLTEALRLAASRSKEVAGLIIQTDGRFQDDWMPAAVQLGRKGTRLLIAPLESPCVDARVAGVAANRLTDGRVRVRAHLQANAPRPRIVRIQRLGRSGRNGADLLTREELLVGTTSLTVEDPTPEGEVAEYRVSLLPPDLLAENDALTAVMPPVTQQVAFISPPAEGLDPLKTAGAGVSLVHLRADEAPRDPTDWLAYAGVLLVDPHGDLLDADQRRSLGRYVRGGGGLLLVGAGPHRSPADRGDPLNAVAALMANPYERQPLHVTVVLDGSGSMAETETGSNESGGRVKFQIAADATLALNRHLTRRDSLAVITFSEEARLIYDSGGELPDFMRLRESLEGITPGGPTNVAAAIREATQREPPDGKTSLVLVLSDLAARPFDSSEAAEWFRQGGHRLAVVAIRGGAAEVERAPELELLALRLAAPIRRTDSLVALAETFADLIAESRGESMRTGAFSPGVGRPFGISAAALPAVSAYVPCAPWPESEVLLDIDDDDPFIARRNVGAGRSVSIALAAGEGGDPDWLEAPNVGRLLNAALTWCGRRGGDGRFVGGATREGGQMRLTLTAAPEAKEVNLLSLRLVIYPIGGGQPLSVPMQQTAPGRYSASVPAMRQACTLVVEQEGRGVVWQQALDDTYPLEFGRTGVDWQSLRRLAEATGGRIASPREIRHELGGIVRSEYVHFWPWLAALSVLSMLVEWACSRR